LRFYTSDDFYIDSNNTLSEFAVKDFKRDEDDDHECIENTFGVFGLPTGGTLTRGR